MLLQMAMAQTPQGVGHGTQAPATPASVSPNGSVSSAVKRARSSFAVTELQETPYHGDHVADDEKADDVRNFKGSMGSLCWVQTPELWRGGRVDIQDDTVTVQGSVCVVANVEISASRKDSVVEWTVDIEKIPNRCWIGIVPGPLLEIGSRWKIGECPPMQGIGVENTYGKVYKGPSKLDASLFRAPKNRDIIRFKLNFEEDSFSGSLNDEKVDKVWYSGKGLPKIACIAIINSTGRGKFQLRRGRGINSK